MRTPAEHIAVDKRRSCDTPSSGSSAGQGEHMKRRELVTAGLAAALSLSAFVWKRTPLRISTDPADAGYAAWAAADRSGYWFRVLLDGKEVSECVTADESIGMATQVVRDSNGNMVAIENFEDREDEFPVVTRTLNGHVVLELLRKTYA